MKKFLFFAAALLGLVACNNKGNEPINPGRQITLTATVDFGQGSNAPGRTVAPNTPIPTDSGDIVNFHWEKGDQIMLLDEDTPEWQFFTVIDNSIKGNTANFTGTALQNMSSYSVYYLGKNPTIEKLMAIMSPSGTDSVTYEANNFHPRVITGTGNETSIVLDDFLPVFQIPLKGNATVGKIDYYVHDTNGDKGTVRTTMSFGTGLVLTDTETPVYFPISGISSKGFTIEIYDTNDVCLLTKAVTDFKFLGDSDDWALILTFPALTVNTAPE